MPVLDIIDGNVSCLRLLFCGSVPWVDNLASTSYSRSVRLYSRFSSKEYHTAKQTINININGSETTETRWLEQPTFQQMKFQCATPVKTPLCVCFAISARA